MSAEGANSPSTRATRPLGTEVRRRRCADLCAQPGPGGKQSSSTHLLSVQLHLNLPPNVPVPERLVPTPALLLLLLLLVSQMFVGDFRAFGPAKTATDLRPACLPAGREPRSFNHSSSMPMASAPNRNSFVSRRRRHRPRDSITPTPTISCRPPPLGPTRARMTNCAGATATLKPHFAATSSPRAAAFASGSPFIPLETPAHCSITPAPRFELDASRSVSVACWAGVETVGCRAQGAPGERPAAGLFRRP